MNDSQIAWVLLCVFLALLVAWVLLCVFLALLVAWMFVQVMD